MQKFLQVYWVKPYRNITLNIAPAELMFSRKIKTVFDNLLPERKNKVVQYAGIHNQGI